MKRVSLKLIIGAFITLTVLIAAQTIYGVYQLAATQARINTVVALHNRKIDIVTRIQVAAHMRTDRLLRMTLEQDPFERDTLYLEFLRAGFLVGSGRNALRELGLTPVEQASFDRQTTLIGRIEEAQARVTDLVLQDRIDEGNRVLVSEAVPVQEAFNQRLAELRDLLQNENDQALVEAGIAYRNSLWATIASGSMATLLGALLGWFTLSRISASRRMIQHQMEQLESSRAALEIEATHDALTGLANRRLFYDHLEQAISRARRYKHMVGVLFIDLDRFKAINDKHGHQIGDVLLMEVGNRLKQHIRESDTVARTGGDEFMIVLDHLNSRSDCEHIVRQFEQTLSGHVEIQGIKIRLGASIGQAVFPDDGKNEDELVRAADTSMYDIKTGQRLPNKNP